MIKIKVCGMRAPHNIEEVAHLSPDMMGFIFYENSPRNIALPSETEQALRNLPPRIKRVGVFVNEQPERVTQIAHSLSLDYLQLHGEESAEYCRTLHNSNLRLIKAFGIDADFDFSILQSYIPHVDMFLFDTRSASKGGSGLQWDWNILRHYRYNVPYILSGGIDAAAIEKIELLSRCIDVPPFCIDVNSQFETEPGVKDCTKLKELFGMVRKYHVDSNGYYGKFGGAYIPEMLHPNIEELRDNYLDIIESESFHTKFHMLLRDYAGRPTPLYYAARLSEKYEAHIYLKREDLCHTGAHKINNTIGQILLAAHIKKRKIIAETGAGQHGVATAAVCACMGMECVIFMGEVDIARQKLNVARMKLLGATVVPVTSGNRTLKDATNEALRHWINHPDCHYLLGSTVGPHPYPDMVARFQSIISQEVGAQLHAKIGTTLPTTIIACVGGGSNAMGIFYHYLDNPDVTLMAVEAGGCGVETGKTAATTKVGTIGILHGSKTLFMQTEDGQVREPYSISAGLDYPGIGPAHAHLFETGRVQYHHINDDEALAAGVELCRLEGILPAIESTHALALLPKLQFQPDEVVVINLSGRGDKDLETYMDRMHDGSDAQ